MTKPIDPTLASPFRVDWFVPMDETSADDFTRAIAEKAATILRSARFIGMHAQMQDTDMEIRVWVEAAAANACVSITWEPGMSKFGFHLLDESLRERLACVVFEKLPCIDADSSLGQADALVDAALSALREQGSIEERAARVRESSARTRRLHVRSDEADVDLGVDR